MTGDCALEYAQRWMGRAKSLEVGRNKNGILEVCNSQLLWRKCELPSVEIELFGSLNSNPLVALTEALLPALPSTRSPGNRPTSPHDQGVIGIGISCLMCIRISAKMNILWTLPKCLDG